MTTEEKSKAISIHVKHAHRSRYKNQRRHDLRLGQQPSYVESDRSHLNRILIDLPMPADITNATSTAPNPHSTAPSRPSA